MHRARFLSQVKERRTDTGVHAVAREAPEGLLKVCARCAQGLLKVCSGVCTAGKHTSAWGQLNVVAIRERNLSNPEQPWATLFCPIGD